LIDPSIHFAILRNERDSMDILDNIECVSSTDGLEEEEALAHLPRHPYPKSSSGVTVNVGVVAGANGTATGAIAGGPMMPPATSVHELLECPVCTNSMYPPIHQVCNLVYTLIF
jgi:E3 ubiquitin-protein ligase SIAH1